RRRRFLARDSDVAYAFIAPAFFLLLVLVAYPFVLSVWFSVSDARVGNTGSFVGLSNFSHLLSSSIFLQTLQNSIVFTAAALTAKTVFGMGLALLLFRVVHFKRLIRGAVLLPFIVPGGAIGWRRPHRLLLAHHPAVADAGARRGDPVLDDLHAVGFQ